MFLPINKSCYKLLRIIYTNLGIKVSALLKKARVSQRIGYNHIDRLLSIEVIKEVRDDGLRSLYPNLSTRAGESIYSLMELEFEYELINMYPELKKSLSFLRDNANALGIECVLLFGNFIKKRSIESPIELLVISEGNHDKVPGFMKQCFSTVSNPVRARIATKQGFVELRRTKPDVFRGLFNNHVCVLNPSLFLRLSS